MSLSPKYVMVVDKETPDSTGGNTAAMNINLEYYKIFYYVASLGGITAAAGKLCISQPAVSQSIKRLEKQIGGALFLRTPKGVRLTPEGQTLFSYVQKGYEMILLGEEQFQKRNDLENGEIHIGASDMTLKYYLLPYLERFHSIYPGIKVVVTNAPTPDTCRRLEEGKIDFGVVSSPVQERSDITLRPVRAIEDVFVAGNRYTSLKHRTVRYQELEKVPLICLEKNTSTRRYMDGLLAEIGVIMEPEFQLATSDMIVQFALRNLGIGCVVRDFAVPYLECGELFEILFERKIPKREMYVVTMKQNPMSTAAHALLKLMEEGIG